LLLSGCVAFHLCLGIKERSPDPGVIGSNLTD